MKTVNSRITNMMDPINAKDAMNKESMPILKRVEKYGGTTNSSGIYTVTFSTAIASTPNIQADIVGGSDTQSLRVTSISTTAFTVTARNRTDVLGLLPTYANASGLTVNVLVSDN